jgi:hypothetical protein
MGAVVERLSLAQLSAVVRESKKSLHAERSGLVLGNGNTLRLIHIGTGSRAPGDQVCDTARPGKGYWSTLHVVEVLH